MSDLITDLVALNGTAVKVYVVLEAAQRGAGANTVRTYRRDLAALLNRSQRTITTALSLLRTKGLIVRLGQARYGVRTR